MFPRQCNLVWEFDAAIIGDEHEEIAKMAKSSGSQNGRMDYMNLALVVIDRLKSCTHQEGRLDLGLGSLQCSILLCHLFSFFASESTGKQLHSKGRTLHLQFLSALYSTFASFFSSPFVNSLLQ